MIRVHEIGMQTLRSHRDAVEQRMRLDDIERVPAHVRDFQVGIVRCDAADVARDPAQSFRDFVFTAALRHQLHADADAKERPAIAAHAVIECIYHTRNSVEAAPAIRKRADAGQHHAVGARHLIGIAGHHNGLIMTDVVRRALERLGGGMQIPGAVIDNRHTHRGAPASGNKPMMPGEAGVRRLLDVTGAGGTAVSRWTDNRSTQESKKRRSAISTLSPTTTPTSLQPRRPSVKRRSVPDSKATSKASSTPATTLIVPGAPRKRRPICSAANNTT